MALIESLQPYQKGDKAYKAHPLWLLNELCNVDKHVVLPIRASDGQFRISGAAYQQRRETSYGFELYYELTDKYKLKIESMTSEIIFGVPVGSGGGGFEMRIEQFAVIHKFFEDTVIPSFVEFFQ